MNPEDCGDNIVQQTYSQNSSGCAINHAENVIIITNSNINKIGSMNLTKQQFHNNAEQCTCTHEKSYRSSKTEQKWRDRARTM